MNEIINFFITCISFVGGLFTLVSAFGVLLTFTSWVLGITPLIWRLGLGRWVRKIAVVAEYSVCCSLKQDLVDSGIFRESNIKPVSKDHLSQVKDHSLILVHYQSFDENEICQMLKDKQSSTGMIFYFPEFNPSEGQKIPDHMVQEIGKKENTVIVNFRGRLLNDIIITLITTSYEKR